MRELLELFGIFCRIGGLTFGGGYAMLPMIQREVVDRRGWATEEEVLDWYAIGQCTPGIIAVNTATFVGYKRRGIPGAICATAGIVFPSLIIITVIAAFLKNFAELEGVQRAFSGIRVAVSAMVVNAVVKLWKTGVKDLTGLLIFSGAFLLTAVGNVSPVLIVLGAVLLGIGLMGWKRRGGRA